MSKPTAAAEAGTAEGAVVEVDILAAAEEEAGAADTLEAPGRAAGADITPVVAALVAVILEALEWAPGADITREVAPLVVADMPAQRAERGTKTVRRPTTRIAANIKFRSPMRRPRREL